MNNVMRRKMFSKEPQKYFLGGEAIHKLIGSGILKRLVDHESLIQGGSGELPAGVQPPTGNPLVDAALKSGVVKVAGANNPTSQAELQNILPDRIAERFADVAAAGGGEIYPRYQYGGPVADTPVGYRIMWTDENGDASSMVIDGNNPEDMARVQEIRRIDPNAQLLRNDDPSLSPYHATEPAGEAQFIAPGADRVNPMGMQDGGDPTFQRLIGNTDQDTSRNSRYPVTGLPGTPEEIAKLEALLDDPRIPASEKEKIIALYIRGYEDPNAPLKSMQSYGGMLLDKESIDKAKRAMRDTLIKDSRYPVAESDFRRNVIEKLSEYGAAQDYSDFRPEIRGLSDEMLGTSRAPVADLEKVPGAYGYSEDDKARLDSILRKKALIEDPRFPVAEMEKVPGVFENIGYGAGRMLDAPIDAWSNLKEGFSRGYTPDEYQYGGPVDPVAQQMPPGEMDPAILEGLLSDASQTTGDLEQAEDFDSLLSGMTGGDVTSVEQTRSELAAIVGPEDAEQTPESVLTLVQPVLMMAGADQGMAGADQGIGPLAQDAMSAPVSDPTMTQGLASMPGMV